MSETSPAYIPLHVRSCYSINDGLQNVGEIVKRARELRFPALALTDLNNLAGFVRFYNACQAEGIKPIMGADLQVWEKARPGEDSAPFSVTLLAMNRTGRQNLYDILSDAWLRSADPNIDLVGAALDDLARYSEGLLLLNGFRGDLAGLLRAGDTRGLEERLAFYKQYFPGRLCLEITRTGREGESAFERAALDLCVRHGFFPVATNDTRFLYGAGAGQEDGLSDYYVHEIRVAIQKGLQKGSRETARMYSGEQYLKSPAEMAALFADLPEALENTRAVAALCNVEIELDHPRLPRYDTGTMSAAEYLRKAAREGLEKRLLFLYPDAREREAKRPEYAARLETELDVIINMDFPGYFLIVMEFIQWSKEHGVPVGPGRGSGGGSLVAYALTITDFDPLRFDLLFERFLNPERVSMPDFDIDFCQRKRYLTVQHVIDHYGRDAVSQIAAFGTLAPKAAIQAVGRAIGIPLGAVRRIAGLIPEKPGTTFDDCLGIGKKGEAVESAAPEFLRFYNQIKLDDDQETIELINLSRRLEGVIRSIGKHAAGVVISPTRISEFSPLMLDADGNPITQFDKKDVEHAGLVKFDFLGLTTLTIIDDAREMIDLRLAREGRKPLNIAAIPYEDERSYTMIQAAETTAVFQLESDGMRRLIAQMKPDRFDDLIALVALYRPGPLNSGMVEHFVRRKHGQEAVSYPLPEAQDLDLKPILDSTYGVIVYQEQVMQIAQVLAGYSLGGADILRRAMGKKIPAEMAAQRDVFLKGCEKKHKDGGVCMKIFDQVEMFAAYGFNKSHSAAYALVAWWTLWLKAHYPAEFLAAMMTADCDKTEKLITYIAECRRLGVNVNPPDINTGKFHFGVSAAGEVIYGFSGLKGVGEKLAERLVAERERGGPYADLFDFVSRVGMEYLSKLPLEALIKSGAFDNLERDRASLFASIPLAVKYTQQSSSDRATGQLDLFAAPGGGSPKPALVRTRPWPDRVRLHYEKSVLGLYLSGHPLDACRAELQHIRGLVSIRGMPCGTPDRPCTVRIAGAVISAAERVSGKEGGEKYFVLKLDDGTDNLEFFAFGRTAGQYERLLQKRESALLRAGGGRAGANKEKVPSPLILLVTGLASLSEDGSRKFRPRDITTLEEERALRARRLTLSCPRQALEENLAAVDAVLRSCRMNAADIDRELSLAEDRSRVVRGCELRLLIDNLLIAFKNDKYRYYPADILVEELGELMGPGSVRIEY